jgi:hypothetical protein
MRKVALTVFSLLVIAASSNQMVAASADHARSGRGYDRWDYRRAHNQWTEPFYAVHLRRLRQHANFRNLYLDPRKSIQRMLHPDPEQGLCSTAPGFCPDYHGENGS